MASPLRKRGAFFCRDVESALFCLRHALHIFDYENRKSAPDHRQRVPASRLAEESPRADYLSLAANRTIAKTGVDTTDSRAAGR